VLEVAWEALESAAVDPQRLIESTQAVFSYDPHWPGRNV